MAQGSFPIKTPSLGRVFAALCAQGSEHPSEVSRATGVEPTVLQMKGRAGTWRKGRWVVPVGARLAEFSQWTLSTEATISSPDPVKHIDYLLSNLESSDEGLASLRDRGWVMKLVLNWPSGTLVLSSDILGRMAELELELELNTPSADEMRRCA